MSLLQQGRGLCCRIQYEVFQNLEQSMTNDAHASFFIFGKGRSAEQNVAYEQGSFIFHIQDYFMAEGR